MMTANPYEVYRQQEVLSANRGDLLLLLYDGCIKQLKLARLFLGEHSIQESSNALIKAQNIIGELMNGLDMQYEVAPQLMALYEFFQDQLVAANISKDAAPLEPVLDMMAELRDTWQQAIQIQKAAAVVK